MLQHEKMISLNVMIFLKCNTLLIKLFVIIIKNFNSKNYVYSIIAQLKNKKYPYPYKIKWINKGFEINVT